MPDSPQELVRAGDMKVELTSGGLEILEIPDTGPGDPHTFALSVHGGEGESGGATYLLDDEDMIELRTVLDLLITRNRVRYSRSQNPDA